MTDPNIPPNGKEMIGETNKMNHDENNDNSNNNDDDEEHNSTRNLDQKTQTYKNSHDTKPHSNGRSITTAVVKVNRYGEESNKSLTKEISRLKLKYENKKASKELKVNVRNTLTSFHTIMSEGDKRSKLIKDRKKTRYTCEVVQAIGKHCQLLELCERAILMKQAFVRYNNGCCPILANLVSHHLRVTSKQSLNPFVKAGSENHNTTPLVATRTSTSTSTSAMSKKREHNDCTNHGDDGDDDTHGNTKKPRTISNADDVDNDTDTTNFRTICTAREMVMAMDRLSSQDLLLGGNPPSDAEMMKKFTTVHKKKLHRIVHVSDVVMKEAGPEAMNYLHAMVDQEYHDGKFGWR